MNPWFCSSMSERQPSCARCGCCPAAAPPCCRSACAPPLCLALCSSLARPPCALPAKAPPPRACRVCDVQNVGVLCSHGRPQVSALFPEEAEAALQPAARLADLATAAVCERLDRGDVAGAREWMRRHAIRAPSLVALIDSRSRALEASRNPVAQARARVQPATHSLSGAAAAMPHAAARAAAAVTSAAGAALAVATGAGSAHSAAAGGRGGSQRYAQISRVDDLILALPDVPQGAPDLAPALARARASRLPEHTSSVGGLRRVSDGDDSLRQPLLS